MQKDCLYLKTFYGFIIHSTKFSLQLNEFLFYLTFFVTLEGQNEARLKVETEKFLDSLIRTRKGRAAATKKLFPRLEKEFEGPPALCCSNVP